MLPTISDGRAGLTPQLPAGLQLGDELFGDQPGAELDDYHAFGCVFRVADLRMDASVPVARVIRLLKPSATDESWTAPLIQRLGQLLGRSMCHVATVHEAGTTSEGSLYLITDYYSGRLDQRIRQDGGVEAPLARRLARQLLEGLAALHRAGLAHGDLRPSNIFLDDGPENGVSAQAWIGDAAIGGLTFWSGGARRDADASYYRPPSWHGEVREPTPKADLFALGMTLCELLLGFRANPARGERGATAATFFEEIKQQLKSRSVDLDLRQLILALVTDGPETPNTAVDALCRFNEWELRAYSRPYLWRLLALTSARCFFQPGS